MKQTGRALWLLCKVQFLGLFDYNRIRKSGDRKKERRFSLMVGLMVLIGLLCAGISTFYSYLFGFLFLQIGKIQLLPVLMMAVTSLVVLCTTVYKAPTTLFSFQDYDLVMSLPVRQPVVIASRMLLLYGMNLGFTLVLMLPAGILYGIFAAIPVSYWFLFGFPCF